MGLARSGDRLAEQPAAARSIAEPSHEHVVEEQRPVAEEVGPAEALLLLVVAEELRPVAEALLLVAEALLARVLQSCVVFAVRLESAERVAAGCFAEAGAAVHHLHAALLQTQTTSHDTCIHNRPQSGLS